MSCNGEPLEECRITIASAPIACSVRAVSFRLSPFETLDPPALKLITSADSRLAASSKQIRVRVEFSKKKFTTVRPRSAGTFLMTREPTSRKDSAVSRMRMTSSAVTSCIESRCSFIEVSSTTTASSPSSSVISTRTSSSRCVGTFLPTKSARIGSSRWPRSTSTARWILRGRPKSISASMAARIVRPVNSTSSTRTTVRPVMSKPIRVSCTSGASAFIPMSSR